MPGGDVAARTFAHTHTPTLLLYAQDHHGLGHVTRTLTVARHVLAAFPNLVAYITTKSPLNGGFTLPERCDYIKLPTLVTPAATERTVAEEEAAKQRFRTIRGHILREAALGLAPDLVVVDHEPLGAKGEFRDGLSALKAASARTKFVFGMRDIMDDTAHIRKLWRDLGVYEALDHLYDGIAVYGSADLYDVAEAYEIPKHVRPKLHYCGYIVRDPPPVDALAVRRQLGLPERGPLVLATVGSGSDGYPVLDAGREALDRLRATFPDLVAVLVTGPFMPADQQAELQARATSWCRVLPAADNFRLIVAADAVLGMGGYNSVVEALRVGRPLVIVPRATHKIEQQIRAETLAAHGLARWVHPSASDRVRLADALEWALGCDRRAHAERVRDMVPFDGAARVTAYLSRWLGAD